jgi:L-amino acid N-acyltransferase YncA
MFSVVSGYLNTRPYIDAVQLAADQDRDALGFFPASVFAEFGKKDRLYVLLLITEHRSAYAGHVLFDCQYPRAVVRQIYVAPETRSQGGARALLQKLKDDLTELGFTSIYARVAADLSITNAFWEKQGFRVQRVDPGGTTRNRTIFVRCHELQSRQLFPSSGVDQNNPLGLKRGADTELPLYLVDLNVLYDLGPRRLRHAEATALFAAERMNFCRLAISTELGEELRRSASPGRTDPMSDYIRIYPAFPLTEEVHRLTN